MADRTIMNAKDAVSASLAECFVTIGDNRYNFMQAINLEANFEKNKTEVPILGKTGKGNKATGWKGTGSATFHYGNVEEYKSVADAFNEGMSTFDTFQHGWAADAFASGAAWGDGVADKVSGMFDFSALDSMGADSLDAFNLGNDLDSIYGNTGDIANNTAATADALDIAEEDLAYLRDIAEREAINRFTTAEIKVEQHNENHISSEMDIDGIMDAWTENFAERLAVSAEGVHK